MLLLEINNDTHTIKQLLDKGRLIENKIAEFFENGSYKLKSWKNTNNSPKSGMKN